MTRDQLKHLTERMTKTANRQKWEEPRSLGEPVNVKQARVVIERFEKERQTRVEQVRARIERAREEVAEAILFGEENFALAALKEFEKRRFWSEK